MVMLIMTFEEKKNGVEKRQQWKQLSHLVDHVELKKTKTYRRSSHWHYVRVDDLADWRINVALLNWDVG